jgi:hypothetical protein
MTTSRRGCRKMANRILAIALVLSVGACGGNLAPVAATLTPAVLTPAQLVKVQQTCQVASPMLAVAAQPGMPATVSDTAVYGKAYCDQLLAGTVPPATDANTPSWLPKVIEGVQIAAAVAKVALPLILPLL